jgi:hypothetical protein
MANKSDDETNAKAAGELPTIASLMQDSGVTDPQVLEHAGSEMSRRSFDRMSPNQYAGRAVIRNPVGIAIAQARNRQYRTGAAFRVPPRRRSVSSRR